MSNQCDCAELRMDGKPLQSFEYAGGRHDCNEVRRRNRFINQASARAHASTTGETNVTVSSAKFNYHFAREMERLCANPNA